MRQSGMPGCCKDEKHSQCYLVPVSWAAYKLYSKEMWCDEIKMSVQEIFLNYQIDDMIRQEYEADKITK